MATAFDCSEQRTVSARRSSPPRMLPRDVVRDWLPLTDTHLRKRDTVPSLSIKTAIHAGEHSHSPASAGGESEAKAAASRTPSADYAGRTSPDTGDSFPAVTASPLRTSSGAAPSPRPHTSPGAFVSSAFGLYPVFPSPPSKPRSREQPSSLSSVTDVSRVQPSGSSEARSPASSRPATPSLLSPPLPAASGRLLVSARSPVLVDCDSSPSSGRERPAPPAVSRSEPATAIAREARPTLPRSLSQSAVPTSSPSPESRANRVSTLFKRGLFGRSKPDQPNGGSSPMQPRSPITHLRGADIPAAYRITPTLSLTTFPTGRSEARSGSPQPLPTHSPSLRSVSPVYQSYFDQQPLETARTWKSLLDNDAIVHLTLQHGHDEMHRQEIIFEIIETERAFVESMRTVIEVYGQPIRAGDIEGVPRSVARLFSRLERILDLHARLSSTLAVAADTQNAGRLVMHFADLIAPYISEFEVYQAYLLRFEAVTAVLDLEVAAGTSPFAAFLHEHARRPGAGGMSLSSFLLKPIQRLMKYPLFFAVSALGAFLGPKNEIRRLIRLLTPPSVSWT